MNQLIVQKKIHYYISFVKNLLSGLVEEFQTEKVHYRRILPVIDRLFLKESPEFLSFFNGRQNSESWQLLQLMHHQGEILNEGKGYYSLLPERIIQFPVGEINVRVSGLNCTSIEKYCGLAQLDKTKQFDHPILTVDDYAYRPELLNIISVIERKMTILKLEFNEVVRFTKGKQLKSFGIRNIKNNEWFIAIHETSFNRKDYYVALKKENTIYGAYIPKKKYLRICYALCDFYGIKNEYMVKALGDGLIEINLRRRLPREEISLLNLIALPCNYDNPKSFIIHELQLETLKIIFDKLKLKEMDSVGIYNK